MEILGAKERKGRNNGEKIIIIEGLFLQCLQNDRNKERTHGHGQ